MFGSRQENNDISSRTDEALSWIVGRGDRKRWNKKAVLSQREPRDASVNFDRPIEFCNGIVHVACLSQRGFLVDLCLQIAVNYLSISDRV